MKKIQPGYRPNIILIVLDSVRQDHLSSYGYSRNTTPNIDSLAAEGTLFENAYSTSCWTIPSHASLFTGLYPSKHGVNLEHNLLPPEHETMAGYLKALGYHTACISCNSFVAGGGTDLNRGFDLTIDVDGYREGESIVDRGIRFLQKRWRKSIHRDRGAARAARIAGEYMDAQHGPFFLFMNFMDCHLPYRLQKRQRYQFIPPMERKRVDRIPLDPFAVMAGELELSPREIAGIRALYDGSLYYLDQQVGRLVSQLKERGIFEQTIVLITSDHGESFGEHGLFDHQYGLYEHLLRVPLVAHFPNGSLSGERIKHMIQLVDLFPILKRLVGGPNCGLEPEDYVFLRKPIRALALSEYLVPNLKAIHRRFPNADVSRFDKPLRAMINKEYKLILRRDGTCELYNLINDPGETVDLSATKREKAAELEARLAALLGPWPGSGQAASQFKLDEELRERLEAMGYL